MEKAVTVNSFMSKKFVASWFMRLGVSILLLVCFASLASAQGGDASKNTNNNQDTKPASNDQNKKPVSKTSTSAVSKRAAPVPAARKQTVAAKAAKEKAEKERLQRETDESLARERAERERAQQEAAAAQAARDAAEAKRRELEAKLPNGRIQSVWFEPNITQDGRLGMKIHAKFDVNNLIGTECEVAAYFFFSSGDQLKDRNNSFTSTGGTGFSWQRL